MGGIPPTPSIGAVSSKKSFVDQFEAFAKQCEDLVDDYCKPFKPYVVSIGRFFIVATFYEDSLRIFTQWSEQVYYLHNYKHIWKWLTVFFLTSNIVLMTTASTMLILRKRNEIATIALISVVLLQGVFYGLIFDGLFILRNLSVVGGLILAFSDSLVRDKRSFNVPGIPMVQNQDNKKYYLLAGRLLLVLLFIGFAFSSSWSFTRTIVILIGFVTCASIIVGYKTKFAASVLTLMLFIYNVFANQFWRYGSHDSSRDFLKYEFFQTLSIVGGLLIIVNAGAGELSLDEKKKIY
ncbi:SURF4-domain-containing protein [Yamadazyma tenuis ATCC 10573]|uniref:SURF4-domain-containing protein n=2 Tax=Candida tenuis TaxID=2315449 RepID=G3B6B6_CANTC|nr:SURF4-domain-containing protein [Yamadazyma tenuis ATCC 10573]EGV63431.1 SURF4-domain-containing protein [Yamadazyma tenuis ATCC 10573]